MKQLANWAAALVCMTGLVSPVSADDDERELTVLYNGYFFGLRVMKASVTAEVVDGIYLAESNFRAAGVLGFFSDAEILATSIGVVDAQGMLRPREYTHTNAASEKGRIVRVVSDETSTTPFIDPPFGSMGEPPATAEQRAGAMDWLTMYLNSALSYGGEPCNHTIPVFDGKQRIDIRMELVGETTIDVRGYEGPVYECHAYYAPIAGFDPEDLAEPETYERPFTIFLTKRDDNVTVPVRIQVRMNGLSVRVDAKYVGVSDGTTQLASLEELEASD